MQIHNLQPTIKKKRRKRIGRGGKRGAYSGRGQKGQKAHAGRKLPKSSMEVVYKIPKLRGLKNKPAKKVIRIDVSDLEKYAKEGIITRDSVIKRPKDKKKEIKILGNGEIKKAFTVVGIKVSKSAEAKIKKAHGKIVSEEKKEKTKVSKKIVARSPKKPVKTKKTATAKKKSTPRKKTK
ncbi:50S ribosomal protein L15 [bacterium]|nr:50S ribosomal protein L15 [bacterium]|tara:strand:- start:685 stop:1221 length:537 start_codon:yes stop_codon:yes gene_type:complete